MATVNVVDLETFDKVVLHLENNTDFFDPLYLDGSVPWNALHEEDMTDMFSDSGIDSSEGWMVVEFLQDYSDVDLLDHAKNKKNPVRRRDDVNMWFSMYIGNALGATELF